MRILPRPVEKSQYLWRQRWQSKPGPQGGKQENTEPELVEARPVAVLANPEGGVLVGEGFRRQCQSASLDLEVAPTHDPLPEPPASHVCN